MARRAAVWRRLASALVLAAALSLAACKPAPEPANPALWRIDAPGGAHGWLFGTIHTLPRAVAWDTPKVKAALGEAKTVVVEIAALRDESTTARAFAALAHTPGQPLLSQRLPTAERPVLARLLARTGLRDDGFADIETWAAALMLGQAIEAQAGADAGNGVDRAILAEAGGKRVIELEGAARQLAIFDRLPEAAQRRLLGAVVTGADGAGADMRELAEAWRRGDMARIGRETGRGLLGDAQLREALHGARNREWAGRVAAIMAAGGQPFVAAGAAHMAGPDSLPALLAARGLKVTRVE